MKTELHESTRLVTWFEELSAGDTPRAGGKGANLGELTAAGLPVPPGFVILADAYLDAMEAAGVRGDLRSICAATDHDEAALLRKRAAHGRDVVRAAGIPGSLRDTIGTAVPSRRRPCSRRFSPIGRECGSAPYAVR